VHGANLYLPGPRGNGLTITLTVEEVIDRICAAECPACKAELPQPGVECAKCGELPEKLRAEVAEELAAPGALAAKRAELHRQEAEAALAAGDEEVNQFTRADVTGDNRIAFAVALAGQLGMLTGLMSAERAAGAAAGMAQAEAEQARRPRVLANTVFPPGVLPR
jgi:hypothetical protein